MCALTNRSLSFLIDATTTILLAIGVILGIFNLTQENAHLFTLEVLFMFKIGNELNWLIRKMVIVEGMMVNYCRIKTLLNLEK